MIVKNRLLDFDSNIYQNDEWFKFSLDSVLLVNFVTLNLRCKKIMDLCSGNAPIPMLLTYRTNANIWGIELQKCIYELGIKSIEENGFDNQISLINDDIKGIDKYFDSDSFDTVICNPPYFKVSSDKYLNDNEVKSIARHEIKLELDDVINGAKFLLKNGGNFAMVHRTERFVEIMDKLRDNGLEPKRIRFIYSKLNKSSDLFLIEAVKNGKSGVKMLSPLIIYDNDGNYTKEVSMMFNNREGE